MRYMRADQHEDKRALARINEINVIATLAKSSNKPLYVKAIKDGWPKVYNLDTEKLVGFTMQGVKAACERLREKGILECERSAAPKRRTKGTPHYWVKGDLDTLYLIGER